MNSVRYLVLISLANLAVVASVIFTGAGLSPRPRHPSLALAAEQPLPRITSPGSAPAANLPPDPPSAVASQLPPPTPDPRCLVTIDGRRYDVSVFRSLHPGGDIFTCGTDMSAVFHQHHDGSYLQKMSQYAI